MNLSEQDFITFRDYIYGHCGIYFHTTKKYFVESRVQRRMEAVNLAAPAAYFSRLKTDQQELKRFLEEITTNETCFFRNKPQLDAIEKVFLPEIVEAKSKIGFRKLRIWSAASSSGEEAYSIAMLLNEKRSTLLKDWIIEIVGTDISEAMLTRARDGIYEQYAVRNMPDFYRKKYLKENGGHYELSPEIKKMVTFNYLNLYDDMKMLFMKSFDFIFCANVLIYFDLQAKSKVVQHFYNNLQPYGYLFIGQSESLHGVSDAFKTVHFPSGFAYRK